jgi:predicted heme/steroid binding protein
VKAVGSKFRRMVKTAVSWLAVAFAVAACGWAFWGGVPAAPFWSGNATLPRRVFTVEELSRFTGGAPLNLTKIAEVQSAARAEAESEDKVKAAAKAKEEGGGGAEQKEGEEKVAPVAVEMNADGEKGAETGESGSAEDKEDTVLVDPSIPIYLAVLGRVFDVTKGMDYYGPEAGGYSGFAGRDGSRAFVTGKFDDVGLVDDVADMTDDQLFSIFEWLDFYLKEEKYIFVGYVEGLHVDASGAKTQYHEALAARMTALHKRKQQEKDAKKGIPSCNTRWASGEGTRIWCDEGRVPRKWFMDPERDSEKYACHCFADPSMPPPQGKVEVYKQCAAEATECKFQDGEER